MMTLMPVAAFAAQTPGVANDGNSYAFTNDDELDTITADAITAGEADVAEFKLRMADYQNTPNATTNTLYVWVTKDGSSVPVESAEIAYDEALSRRVLMGTNKVYTLTKTTPGFSDGTGFYVGFYAPGTYRVYVSTEEPTLENGKISNASIFGTTNNKIVVNAGNVASKYYKADVTVPNAVNATDGSNNSLTVSPVTGTNNYMVKNVDAGSVIGLSANPTGTNLPVVVKANNVEEKTIELDLFVMNGTAKNTLPNKTLKIEPVGSIDTDVTTVTTDMLGHASFKVSGKYEGLYKIYVSSGQFDFTINVQVGSTAANTIKCTDEPKNPIDILGEKDLSCMKFKMYDINGNVVDPSSVNSLAQGWHKAANSDNKAVQYMGENVDATGYVAIVSQPSASKLTNKDLTFNGTNIVTSKAITVEGTYEFKVVLDNGNYATATVEVKEFTKATELVLEYPGSVELGATVDFNDLYWLDANKVEKKAYTTTTNTNNNNKHVAKVSLAATGYAVANFDANSGTLTVKTDEKYVGSEITITAVDERNNLIATATVKVANDAKELKFATKTAQVDVNNKIRVEIVDEDGNVVALGSKNAIQGSAVTEISYVILDKPEGAKVFANTVADTKDKVTTDGYFEMNLTSNKIGNVAVQAVVKYSYMQQDAATNKQVNVVKYYTGTQIFAVGNGSVGDVVVMSIGSHEVIVNDKKATIDAAPMIQNDRTFVPFRALAEAFGAEVAYDEATQAVTAKLNGVEVVMTIGSATYTVNGAEKTADVAPFINGSRTMVPVRFAAEAFGIKVIPTYNPDGTTADILFNL